MDHYRLCLRVSGGLEVALRGRREQGRTCPLLRTVVLLRMKMLDAPELVLLLGSGLFSAFQEHERGIRLPSSRQQTHREDPERTTEDGGTEVAAASVQQSVTTE